MLLKLADVIIRPDVASVNWADFYSYEELAEKGYIATRAKLADIKAIIRKESSFFQRWWGRRKLSSNV